MAKPVMKIISDNSRVAPGKGIPRSEQLPMILSLTTEMFKKANNDEWEAVISLESQRNVLIAEFFATTIAANEVQAVAQHINKVLEIDKQLIDLCSGQRKNLSGNLQKIVHGKNALKVYSSV